MSSVENRKWEVNTMTKKDYIAIAKIIERQSNIARNIIIRDNFIHELAYHFENDNLSFDPQKFLRACGHI